MFEMQSDGGLGAEAQAANRLIDDGCDACLRGPPDDEDGDGVADACDDCPGVPDPAQIDSDGESALKQ